MACPIWHCCYKKLQGRGNLGVKEKANKKQEVFFSLTLLSSQFVSFEQLSFLGFFKRTGHRIAGAVFFPCLFSAKPILTPCKHNYLWQAVFFYEVEYF